jgi:hypothetical protein
MDFDVSEKMQTIVEAVRSFMDNEVIPLEGEMLHGEPAALDAAVAGRRTRSARWAYGRRTILWSSAASV